MRVVALLLASAATAAPVSQQDPQHTLAIAAVESRGGATPEDAAAMGDALTAQLVSDGRLRVVERQQMAKVMKEQALSQSGAMSDEVQIKLAQLVGARWIVVGAIQGSGKGLALSLRAVDSSTGQVVHADTLKVGSADQLEGGARQLARKLENKLAGAPSGQAQAAGEVVGDFDTGQVKDSARALARSLSTRFPKITGHVADSLPDGTATCSFGTAQPFAGQFFEISGRDEVTETDRRKGYFLVKSISSAGCNGKVKRDGPGEIVAGDLLTSVPLKISVDPLEAGAGAQPELAKMLSDETREALKTSPQFSVSEKGQLTAVGRVTGPRGHRVVEVQVVDKGGAVVQRLELPGTF